MSRVTPEQYKSRRDHIVSAATRVFARRGCAAATMQEVAAEAGVSVGALYRYFPGKDDLVGAVFAGIGRRTSALFAQTAAVSGRPGDMLQKAGMILEQRFKEELTRDETVLVLEGILADARGGAVSAGGGRQLRDAYVFLTEHYFREAQADGALDLSVDVRGLASLFVSLMVGIHVLHLEFGEDLELRPLLEAVDDMLLRFAPTDTGSDVMTFSPAGIVGSADGGSEA